MNGLFPMGGQLISFLLLIGFEVPEHCLSDYAPFRLMRQRVVGGKKLDVTDALPPQNRSTGV